MTDIYQTVTDKIVAMIEAGAGPWRMPWHASEWTPSAITLPRNVASGKPYRGINIPLLWAAERPSPVWGTYKQWSEKKAQVRRGEKATLILFWKRFEIPSSADDADDEPETRLVARGYSVFNAAQVDGYEDQPAAPTVSDERRIDHADAFFTRIGAEVRHGGNRAFYMPSTDSIKMPEFFKFDDPDAYYATLGHEHVHWSGAPNRSTRDLSGRFGDAAYAAEELIAELGAAFLCAHLALSNEPRQDHASYVASWLKVLHNDKRAIFTAASKAQAAVDYLVAAAGAEQAVARAA